MAQAFAAADLNRRNILEQVASVDPLRNKRTIHVNAGDTDGQKSSSYSKHKYPLKPFDGTGKPPASEWLNHFEKILEYHEWDTVLKTKEFEMAMFGSADSWLCSLTSIQRSVFDVLLEKFQLQFGGSDFAKMIKIFMHWNTSNKARSQ